MADDSDRKRVGPLAECGCSTAAHVIAGAVLLDAPRGPRRDVVKIEPPQGRGHAFTIGPFALRLHQPQQAAVAVD